MSMNKEVMLAVEAISAAVDALVERHKGFVSAAKIDDLLKKEDNKPFEEDLKAINSEDSTPTKKYLDWGLSRLKAGDDVEDIIAAMMSFEKAVQRLSEKDIKKYKTLEDINKAVKALESKPSARGTKRLGKHSAEVLFEDDNWLLVHPTTRSSAIYYGSKTSWCISRRDLTKNLFYHYSLRNIKFYILIDKSKIHEVKSLNSESTGLDFSKLAILFQEGVSYLEEPFEDANNKAPTLSVVKKALGEELFKSMNGIAKEHALKHKETPTLAIDLKGAILIDADLAGADLRSTDLTGADLTNANLTLAKLIGAILIGADLTDAHLELADLTDAKLIGADLTDAYLEGADLRGADLTGADLTDANLEGADLEGADLTGAYLVDAKLTRANLTNAILTGAILKGVKYNDRTIWPEGFTPPDEMRGA